MGVSILFNLRLVKETHYIEFYDETQLLKNPNNKTNHTKEKYQTTINKRSYLETIAEKIQNVSDDTFKNPNLNLQEFAETIKEPPHLISQTFSTELGTNFNQYTNKKRLEFATDLLLTQPNSTIADIAFKSGFNSEASFYRAFKVQYQTTPRKFQEAYQE